MITDPEILTGYLTDASNVHGRAEGLFRPTSTEEVAAILRDAQAQGKPVTVTAGRTSTTAAAVPEGGWLLAMEQLDAVEHIGEDTATAQGGVLLGAFQDQIEQTGRFYPPDPTSRYECTLGASIATNASGARSFRYGATRPWVQSVEAVLADGTIVTADRSTPIPSGWPVPRWTEPAVKTAAGYVPADNLLDLLIGQEGTLAVITRATVRLTELPAEVLGVLAFFPTRAEALAFVERARSAARADPHGPLSPRCLEYLDRNCLDLAGSRVGTIPDEAGAAIFAEQEVVDEDAHLEAWFEALEQSGALSEHTLLTEDDRGRKELHALRHAVPAGINEIVVQNGMPKVGTDLSVPDSALEEMMDLYEQSPIRYALFGHIGDAHLHLNLLPRDADELARAKAFYDVLAERAVALGGSVSAEHGIGKLKKRHLQTMVGHPVLEQFRALKTHLDPAWILGRGNIVDRGL